MPHLWDKYILMGYTSEGGQKKTPKIYTHVNISELKISNQLPLRRCVCGHLGGLH